MTFTYLLFDNKKYVILCIKDDEDIDVEKLLGDLGADVPDSLLEDVMKGMQGGGGLVPLNMYDINIHFIICTGFSGLTSWSK